MDKYKKLNILLFTVAVLLAGITYLYWSEICIVQDGCSYHERTGLFRPLFQAIMWFGIMTAVFLYFPSHYFKTWLIKIFSWGFPLSLVLVLGIDPQSSNILSPTRSQAAQFLGISFLVLTVLFILIQHRRDKRVEIKP